jgi:hypothetical protein
LPALLAGVCVAALGPPRGAAAAEPGSGLRVSDNGRYLVGAADGKPFF